MFFVKIEDYLKIIKSNIKKKLIFFCLFLIVFISLIISLSEILTSLISLIIPVIFFFIIFGIVAKSELLKFVTFLKSLLSQLEEYLKNKEEKKKSYEVDPNSFEFKDLLEMSNEDEKKALEKFTGIKFKTINQFDTAIRKKSTDNISSLIKRIKGVDKELTIVSYGEILDLVSKNFKLNRDTRNDPQLEQFIIETQFKKMVDKMDKKDRKVLEDEVRRTAEEKFGKNNLDLVLSSSGFIAANLGGFATYTMATTVLGGFTSLLGITLPFAVYTGLTSAISILSGPIGLSILATWGIRKMTKPNIPVSILVVFSISAIRQRLIFEYEENKTKLDLEIKNLNQEKIKLENFYSNLKLLTPKNFLRKLLINNPKDTVLKISNNKL